MAKVTSKLQVTIPKAIAERYAIAPGQEVEWLQAGDAIRVVPHGALRSARDARGRVELFDRATARQHAREQAPASRWVGTAYQRDDSDRGWTREDLYERHGAG
jgi:AbrB family looped-hinge helix DNA binding protein